MRKLFQVLIIILLVLGGAWLFFYSNIDPALINLILLNIVAYICRTIVIRTSNKYFKGRIVRYFISIITNVAWSVFIFMLLFYIEPNIAVAIISFLIVAISLTFRERINNIASGVLILTSDDFKITDLIQTNGIQGIVSNITLNYTKLKDFTGITNYLPNVNVYNASIKKFTSKGTLEENGNKEEKKERKIAFKEYMQKFENLITKEEKLTRYIKILEILPQVEPQELKERLDVVFKRYEEIFGIEPFYYVNETVLGRCSITVQILSKNPQDIIFFLNAFLRDIAIEVYNDDVNEGWDPEKMENDELKKMMEERV